MIPSAGILPVIFSLTKVISVCWQHCSLFDDAAAGRLEHPDLSSHTCAHFLGGEGCEGENVIFAVEDEPEDDEELADCFTGQKLRCPPLEIMKG